MESLIKLVYINLISKKEFANLNGWHYYFSADDYIRLKDATYYLKYLKDEKHYEY